jgi:tRNA(Glu) U13 pseudouridine synthase TruD
MFCDPKKDALYTPTTYNLCIKPNNTYQPSFQLFACQKTYEFQASDHRTRLQWINAIKTAIENAEEPVRYQRALLGSVQNLRPQHFDDIFEAYQHYLFARITKKSFEL